MSMTKKLHSGWSPSWRSGLAGASTFAETQERVSRSTILRHGSSSPGHSGLMPLAPADGTHVVIVYRDVERLANARAFLAACVAGLHAMADGRATDHAQATRLLIDFGELETAVADALFPSADGVSLVAEDWRRAAVAVGHLFVASWLQRGSRALRGRAREVLARIEALRPTLPRGAVRLRVPEGYAYYALYPETYVAAAEQFSRGRCPGTAVCLGLRSIGTSLSAAVAAGLEAAGWRGPGPHPATAWSSFSAPTGADPRALGPHREPRARVLPDHRRGTGSQRIVLLRDRRGAVGAGRALTSHRAVPELARRRQHLQLRGRARSLAPAPESLLLVRGRPENTPRPWARTSRISPAAPGAGTAIPTSHVIRPYSRNTSDGSTSRRRRREGGCC